MAEAKFVMVHVSAEKKDPERDAWLRAEWDRGSKIKYYPCMDGTEYGLHYMYEFEDPELADAFALKFETIDGNC